MEQVEYFGATYSTDPDNFGEITAVFQVDEGWDGWRFNGYCRPTPEEVRLFFGDKLPGKLD